MHYFGRLGGREYEKMKAEENRKTGLSLITAPTASGWSDPLPGGIRTHRRFFPGESSLGLRRGESPAHRVDPNGGPTLEESGCHPITLICMLLGLRLGWLPMLAHGPIAYKFNVLGIRGDIAVWAFYSARLLIGFLVGITRWPGR